VLDQRASNGAQVWTNAYTVSTNGVKMAKPQYIVQHVLQEAWVSRDAIEPCARSGMEVFCKAASLIDGIGGFMAYEVACDLRWCPGWLEHAPDRNSWANLGPGAKRGLNRLCGRPLEASIRNEQALVEMQYLLDLSPIYLGQGFPEPLEMREIEHSLCETDKYLRVKNGEGKPRSLYKQS
jgi:hypothetical protein